MPFKSEAQRRLLWAKKPRLARRWHEEYGTPKDLPMKVEGSGGDGKTENTAKTAGIQGEGSPMAAQQLTHEEKVIDTLLTASAALEKAEQADLQKEAMDKECAALIPEAVKSIMDREIFESDEREKLAEALLDPRKALRILTKVAGLVTPAGSHLGSQVDAQGRTGNGGGNGQVKKASAVMGSADSPYCGARTTAVKPSDLALFRGLNVPGY